MIEISKREKAVIAELVNQLSNDNTNLAITTGAAGYDLTVLEKQLLYDILVEYIQADNQ